MKRLNQCMCSTFQMRSQCSSLSSVLDLSDWLSVLPFNLLWCYWYNSPHISIQTDACVWWKVFLWADVFSLKTPMILDHCRLLKPDPLRALVFCNVKTFQRGLIYSETENPAVSCPCINPACSSTRSLKPQTGEDAFHRILCCKWDDPAPQCSVLNSRFSLPVVEP